MAMINRICVACGGKFKARSADVKRGWGKCCSKSCAATLNNKKTGNYSRYLNGPSKKSSDGGCGYSDDESDAGQWEDWSDNHD